MLTSLSGVRPIFESSALLRPHGGEDGRVAEIRVAIGQFAAQFFIKHFHLPALRIEHWAVMIVAVLIVRSVGESWLAAGIGVAAVNDPAVVEAALPALHREGHDIHFVALGAQTLLHFGEVQIVEKAEVFHVLVLPAMAAGHHCERAAVLVQVVEGHPGGDELIRTARPPIGVISVPAGADARGVARAGGLVEKLIVQQADDSAVHEPGGDGADEWIDSELDHFLLLQGEKFIDPLPVAVTFLPIHEAGVKRQDVINFSVPKALNAIVSRVQQGLGNEAFPGDVVAIRFVEGDVGVAGQEGALFGCEREGLHRWHLRSCQVSSCNARETPRGQTAGRKATLWTGVAAPVAGPRRVARHFRSDACDFRCAV